ncbi:hypothetical protein [Streptomyces sp. ZSW22]|uniref:hypothetical protein n=1 Tax=Streptomyces sp. ZSW22 TaxID=3055050 RepID=UPI0025B22393|nr:hypothetical protein [Streptomyces sp. ZSW22]MDN3249744.1 hypothetical protein [Streptomyces sp. ZSW22]
MDTARYVVVELDLVGTSRVQSPARRGQTGGQVPRGAAGTCSASLLDGWLRQ